MAQLYTLKIVKALAIIPIAIMSRSHLRYEEIQT